jgi:hypothetical protein
MVAFETLLLGVIFGRAPIRLMVAPPVATVEVRLDGTQIAILQGPPWVTDYDFGRQPMPHELTAVGLDASGHQVGRVAQWVNFGRQKAGVSVLLERDPKTHQPLAARMAWRAVNEAEPQAVDATLDGAPLPFSDPRRIPLPPTDTSQPHLVSIEVTFPEDLRERADVAFGGDVIDRAESELTAIAVTLPPKQRSFAVRDAQGLFYLDQTPLQPFAVEKSRAEVALVVDQEVPPALRSRGAGTYPPPSSRKLNPDRDRFYVVNTVPRLVRGPDNLASIFPMSLPRSLSWLDDYGTLRAIGYPDGGPRAQLIANAVAVAAAEVAAYNHRRAVVLLLGDAAPTYPGIDPRLYDGSSLDIAAVRAYLVALNVPLFVWSVAGGKGGPLTAAWGPAEDVSTQGKLRKAFKKLAASLEAQRIVWFSGRHLPQHIAMDESRTTLRLAR